MLNKKSPFPKSEQDKKVNQFISVLKATGLYQPEELYKVVCPFHEDANPSMQINIPEAFFYCYGCGAKGSSLELYELYKQKENKKNKKKGKIKENNKIKDLIEISKLEKNKSNKELYNNIYNIYNNKGNNILNNTNPYLLKGKLKYSEGIKQAKNYYNNLPDPNWFRPSVKTEIEDETRECKAYMQKRGFTALTLKNAQAKPSLNKFYPIVIPLLENGIFRGYVMRTFDPEIEQQRKYMYNTGFKRERTLPGLFGKKRTGTDSVLLVEGYMDKLKANQLGIQSVVAILGWKISNTQIQKLKHASVKTLVCGLDNDEAGNKGYKYLKRIGKINGFEVIRLHYPKGIKDMGDIQRNTEQAQMVLNQLKKAKIK